MEIHLLSRIIENYVTFVTLIHFTGKFNFHKKQGLPQ